MWIQMIMQHGNLADLNLDNLPRLDRKRGTKGTCSQS